MNKTKAVVVLVATLLVAIGVSVYYINMVKQEGVAAPSIEDEWWYEEGFEDAFTHVVECFEARENITERDDEWKEEWEMYCRLAKKSVIRAIVMEEFISFDDVYSMQFENLSRKNITFLDREKKPIPCGRDVLTGKCIDDAYDTPHRHIALNQSRYGMVKVMVVKYNATQVEGITITERLKDTHIIYMVVDDE